MLGPVSTWVLGTLSLPTLYALVYFCRGSWLLRLGSEVTGNSDVYFFPVLEVGSNSEVYFLTIGFHQNFGLKERGHKVSPVFLKIMER